MYCPSLLETVREPLPLLGIPPTAETVSKLNPIHRLRGNRIYVICGYIFENTKMAMKIGTQLPGFAGATEWFGGTQAHAESEVAGHPTLVHFWSASCGICKDNLPRWNTISISGYHIREAGSTAVQEVAFTLVDGIAYVQAALDAGLAVDEFAPQLLARPVRGLSRVALKRKNPLPHKPLGALLKFDKIVGERKAHRYLRVDAKTLLQGDIVEPSATMRQGGVSCCD